MTDVVVDYDRLEARAASADRAGGTLEAAGPGWQRDTADIAGEAIYQDPQLERVADELCAGWRREAEVYAEALREWTAAARASIQRQRATEQAGQQALQPVGAPPN